MGGKRTHDGIGQGNHSWQLLVSPLAERHALDFFPELAPPGLSHHSSWSVSGGCHGEGTVRRKVKSQLPPGARRWHPRPTQRPPYYPPPLTRPTPPDAGRTPWSS